MKTEKQTAKLLLIMVPGNGTMLFVCNWLTMIKLNKAKVLNNDLIKGLDEIIVVSVLKDDL